MNKKPVFLRLLPLLRAIAFCTLFAFASEKAYSAYTPSSDCPENASYVNSSCQCDTGFTQTNNNYTFNSNTKVTSANKNNYTMASNGYEYTVLLTGLTDQDTPITGQVMLLDSSSNQDLDAEPVPGTDTGGNRCWCRIVEPFETIWKYSTTASDLENCATKCIGKINSSNVPGFYSSTGVLMNGETCEGSAVVNCNPGYENINNTCAPITYTISYNLNGGTNNANNPANYTIESSTITFANPTKTGYTFGGWYTDSGFNTSITQIPNSSTGNKTLFAKWTTTTYDITYNLNGGTNNSNNPANYTIESSTITFADPTKDGYTFGGWYTDSGFNTPITQIATGSTGNKTLYAKWTLITYTISYNLNGGTNYANAPTEYTIESSTITFAKPTKTGYTFGGWYTDSGFNTSITQIPNSSTGNKTLYAKWTAIECSNTQYFDAGTNSCINCPLGYYAYNNNCYVNLESGKYITNEPLPSWVDINQDAPASESSMQYYGYNNDNADDDIPENSYYTIFDYGKIYGDSACLTYGSWGDVSDEDFERTNVSGGSHCWCRLNGSNDPNADYTYKSKWVARGILNNNEPCWENCAKDCAQLTGHVYRWADNSIKESLFSTATLRTADCSAGYYCPGGSIESGQTDQYLCPDEYPESQTGSYDKTQCFATLSFETNGGSAVALQTYNYNNAQQNGYSLPSLPTTTKSGYRFDGWYKNSTFTGDPVTTETVLSGTDVTTLYAKWTINTYTVTYNVNGGNELNPSFVNYTADSDALTLPNPTRTYYSFDAWYTEDGTKVGDAGDYYTPTADITLYAHWTAIECDNTQYFDAGTNSCHNCPTEYPYADANATSENQCYREESCPAITCPDHATACSYIGATQWTVYPTTPSAEHCTIQIETCEERYENTNNTCTLLTGPASCITDTEYWDEHSQTCVPKVQSCSFVFNSGQYIPPVFDITNTGYGCHKSRSAEHCSDYSLINGLPVNSWLVHFNNDTNLSFSGRSACSDIGGNTNDVSDVDFTPNRIDGEYCWCHINTPFGSSKWILANRFGDYNICGNECAGNCAYHFSDYTDFRKQIISNIDATPVNCIEGYYCPGGEYDCLDTTESLVKCPDEYPESQTGSYEKTQCFASLSFETNGGSAVDSQTYNYSNAQQNGYTLPSLPTTTKSGYTFAGWYKDSTFTGDPVTTETVLSGTDVTTLYAKWELNNVITITLNKSWGNGGIDYLYYDGVQFYIDPELTEARWYDSSEYQAAHNYIPIPEKSQNILIGFFDSNNNKMIEADGSIEQATLRAMSGDIIGDETWTAQWRTYYRYDAAICPFYENIPGADTVNYLPNSVAGDYVPGSAYKYWRFSENDISECQIFFNVNNNEILHTDKNIPEYTHTMVRARYVMDDDIEENGYIAHSGTYERAVQIQDSGADYNLLLHCEPGYSNKTGTNGMVYFRTLAEALEKACTKTEENYYSDGTFAHSCSEVAPYVYSHGDGNDATACYANVTFIPNNGTNKQSIEVHYSAQQPNAYVVPNYPSLENEGKTLGGWYTTPDFSGNSVSESDTFSETDLMLYARWIDENTESFNITYVLNGGTNYADAPTSYIEGVGATINGVPTKDGFTFIGWCTDAELTNCAPTQTISATDSGDKTFYAKFGCAEGYTQTSYNVLNRFGGAKCYYFTGRGSSGSGTAGIHGVLMPQCNASLLDAPNMWLSVDSDESVLFGETTCIQTPKTTESGVDPDLETTRGLLNGSNCWCRLTNYMDPDGNTTTINSSWFYLDIDKVVENPVSNCRLECTQACVKKFSDFSNLTTFSSSVFATSVSGEDYYVCEPVVYTITYKLNGGTNYADAPTTYTKESDTITFGTPTKLGYIFDGWFVDSGFTTPITGIPHGSTGDKTIYAKWSVDPDVSELIQYELNGGTNYENAPDTYVPGTITIIDGVPTKNSFEFAGWCSDAELTDCSDVYVIPSTAQGTQTIYAKWNFICESNKWYHIGEQEEDKICLYAEKKTSPAVAIATPNKKHYLLLSPDSNLKINNRSDIKMHLSINGDVYNAYDESVYQ